MKPNRRLLALFLLSLSVYIILFASCFSKFPTVPINPSPLLQMLVLHFHGIPMFFLQLLLHRLSKPWWQHLLPFLPILAAALVFMCFAEWYILGWILVLWWCIAPVAGCVLAWIVYGFGKRRVSR